MKRSEVQSGQILTFRGVHFVYVKKWDHDTAFVLPIVIDAKPQTTTEFVCGTDTGTTVVAQCWNCRNMLWEDLELSVPTTLGTVLAEKMAEMWHVVRRAFTGVDVPKEIERSIGPEVTLINCLAVRKYQSEWNRRAHPIQENVIKKFF
ncbi:MAG: hypothetical protein RLZZ347_698 [Candidatus Parcubacteria bacterium]|jgi:hypothetical protein